MRSNHKFIQTFMMIDMFERILKMEHFMMKCFIFNILSNMSRAKIHSLRLFRMNNKQQSRVRHKQLSRLVGKPTMWFPNRSDTNRPVQAQKRARSLKVCI